MRFNADAQADLRNFGTLVGSFHSDNNQYPKSIPLTTGDILLTDGEHEASFSTSKGVYMIFKSKGDNYSAIVTHLSGDSFYAISSSIPWVGSLIHKRKIGCLCFLFQSEEGRLSDMNSYSPVPGQTDWEGWE